MIRINLLPQDEVPRSRSIKLPEIGAFAPVGVIAAVIVIVGAAVLLTRPTSDVAPATETPTTQAQSLPTTTVAALSRSRCSKLGSTSNGSSRRSRCCACSVDVCVARVASSFLK